LTAFSKSLFQNQPGFGTSSEDINLIAGNKAMANIDDFPVVNGLLLEFTDGRSDEKFTSEISLSDGETKMADKYKEKLASFFYSPQFSMTMLPQQIEKLLINKQLDGVIEALQEIDANITDIRMGMTGIIYMDIGLDKLLPINIMGDGIRRILSILTVISNIQGGVLFVDEIENGLHYSTLQILWKAILKALDVYHVQLFATTHSNECIGALVSPDLFDRESQRIRLYRKDPHSCFFGACRATGRLGF
jgi:AAA15 family ATPase/GTPase